jgi:hypothetical protein
MAQIIVLLRKIMIYIMFALSNVKVVAWREIPLAINALT